jgi:hypothetical protein
MCMRLEAGGQETLGNRTARVGTNGVGGSVLRNRPRDLRVRVRLRLRSGTSDCCVLPEGDSLFYARVVAVRVAVSTAPNGRLGVRVTVRAVRVAGWH